MSDKPFISAVIITYNCAATIEETLKGLTWCDEIVVVDGGSTDNTEEICRKYSCKIYHHQFAGFGPQKQVATQYASNDWILSVDSDEILTDELQTEIQRIFANPEMPYKGFYIPITLVFMGRVFKHGKEANSPRLRLFNRNNGGYNDSLIHEKVEVNGTTGKLKNTMLHFSYRDTSHFFEKFNNYSTLAAKEAAKYDKRATKWFIIAKLHLTFFISYFIRRNFLNGYPGFIWSTYDAFYRFVKYLKIQEQTVVKTD